MVREWTTPRPVCQTVSKETDEENPADKEDEGPEEAKATVDVRKPKLQQAGPRGAASRASQLVKQQSGHMDEVRRGREAN